MLRRAEGASEMLKQRNSRDANASRLSHLLTELAKKISNSLGDPGERATEVPGLMLYRRTAPTVPDILNTEEVHIPEASSGACAMATGETTVELVNSCSRMMDLLDAPRDISFFSKLIQREIIYRLLQGSLGARLRAIATFETKCHRTAKAVAWLRSNYEKPLRVEHLATIAGMSRSTLHLHFRALTAMSPLQFQKQLRLHAARQRILTGGLDAASAAFEVGYESPSQFNREYRRFFGQPPIRDIKALQDGKVAALRIERTLTASIS